MYIARKFEKEAIAYYLLLNHSELIDFSYAVDDHSVKHRTAVEYYQNESSDKGKHSPTHKVIHAAYNLQLSIKEYPSETKSQLENKSVCGTNQTGPSFAKIFHLLAGACELNFNFVLDYAALCLEKIHLGIKKEKDFPFLVDLSDIAYQIASKSGEAYAKLFDDILFTRWKAYTPSPEGFFKTEEALHAFLLKLNNGVNYKAAFRQTPDSKETPVAGAGPGPGAANLGLFSPTNEVRPLDDGESNVVDKNVKPLTAPVASCAAVGS